MWFKYGLKTQKVRSSTPWKGRSFVIFAWGFKAFALTGRQVCVRNYPGRCPGLGASALSGRAASDLLGLQPVLEPHAKVQLLIFKAKIIKKRKMSKKMMIFYSFPFNFLWKSLMTLMTGILGWPITTALLILRWAVVLFLSHAARYSERSSDSGQNADGYLKNCFPSFHFFECWMLSVECWIFCGRIGWARG